MENKLPVERPRICQTCNDEGIVWGSNGPREQPKACPTCRSGRKLGSEWFSPKLPVSRQCFAFRDKDGKVVHVGKQIEKMTGAEIVAMLRGDDIRSKGDLRDWTGSLPFHLSKEP